MRILTFVFRKSLPCSNTTATVNRKGVFLKTIFGKHLLLTNIISSGVLMGIGDLCQQRIEIHQAKPNNKHYDVARTVNMTTVAFGHGVYHHFFYGWMERILPGRSMRSVVYKLLLDQVIASPACMWIFFIGMALLERKGYDAGWQEMKKKFLFTYLVDTIVWPPSQFINFYYVPAQYRVLYINSLTMVYDVFLSYVKFYDQTEKESKA